MLTYTVPIPFEQIGVVSRTAYYNQTQSTQHNDTAGQNGDRFVSYVEGRTTSEGDLTYFSSASGYTEEYANEYWSDGAFDHYHESAYHEEYRMDDGTNRTGFTYNEFSSNRYGQYTILTGSDTDDVGTGYSATSTEGSDSNSNESIDPLSPFTIVSRTTTDLTSTIYGSETTTITETGTIYSGTSVYSTESYTIPTTASTDPSVTFSNLTNTVPTLTVVTREDTLTVETNGTFITTSDSDNNTGLSGTNRSVTYNRQTTVVVLWDDTAEVVSFDDPDYITYTTTTQVSHTTTNEPYLSATVLLPEKTPEKNDWVWVFNPIIEGSDGTTAVITDYTASEYQRWNNFFTSISEAVTIKPAIDEFPVALVDATFTGGDTMETTTVQGTSTVTTVIEVPVSYTQYYFYSYNVDSTVTTLSSFTTELTSWNHDQLPMSSDTFVFAYQDTTTTVVNATGVHREPWTDTYDGTSTISHDVTFSSTASPNNYVTTAPGFDYVTLTSTGFLAWVTSDQGWSWSLTTSTYLVTIEGDPIETVFPMDCTITTGSSYYPEASDQPTGTNSTHTITQSQYNEYGLSNFNGSSTTYATIHGFELSSMQGLFTQFENTILRGFQIQPNLATTDGVFAALGADIPMPYAEYAIPGFQNYFMFPNEAVQGKGVRVFYPVGGLNSFQLPIFYQTTATDTSETIWVSYVSSTNTSDSDFADFSRFTVTQSSTVTTMFGTQESTSALTTTFVNNVFGMEGGVTAVPSEMTVPFLYFGHHHAARIGGRPRGPGERTLAISGCFDETVIPTEGTTGVGSTINEIVPTMTTTTMSTNDVRAIKSMSAYFLNASPIGGGDIFSVQVYEAHYGTGGNTNVPPD